MPTLLVELEGSLSIYGRTKHFIFILAHTCQPIRFEMWNEWHQRNSENDLRTVDDDDDEEEEKQQNRKFTFAHRQCLRCNSFISTARLLNKL